MSDRWSEYYGDCTCNYDGDCYSCQHLYAAKPYICKACNNMHEYISKYNCVKCHESVCDKFCCVNCNKYYCSNHPNNVTIDNKYYCGDCYVFEPILKNKI